MESTIRLLLLQLALYIALVQGHGRLIEPPSRSSMWRFGFKTPANYNDNQLFCGGFGVQYSSKVNGRCGVCGDPWFGPRENEVGGKYAKGIITRKYKVGQVIDVTIDLTANHKGYFEFRLCQKDDPKKKATWDCMNKNLLVDDETGLTRYHVKNPSFGVKIKLRMRLPEGVKCRACVLQWKYNAGNSWGTDKDGKSCVGCGNQEQFYGCSDVAIGYDDVKLGEKNDDSCSYEHIQGDDWKWNCSGKTLKAKDFKGYSNNSSTKRESSYFSLYLVSFILFVMQHLSRF